MVKKFYAVKKGLTPGIYTDWDSCKAQINGFPGAQYKGFATKAEAENYINGNPDHQKAPVSAIPLVSDNVDSSFPFQIKPGTALAYVDGSFKESAGKFSYGVVFFSHGEDGNICEQHFCKGFTNPELLEMRNVSGEIMGAAQAMKSAKEMGLGEITIYHDYEGIAKWCQGLWKANKPWVQKYKAFYDEISKELKVNFVKVKGHSNDKYNDLADELAKAALE